MIDQLSASYNQNEDRVLFKFNTKSSEEYAFWLSRKIVQEIMNAIPRHTQEGLAVFQKIRSEGVKRGARTGKVEETGSLQKDTVPEQGKDKSAIGRAKDKSAVAVAKDKSAVAVAKDKSAVAGAKETFRAGDTFPIGENPVLVVNFKQDEMEDKLCLHFHLIDGRNLSWRVSNGLFLKMHSLLEAVLVEANWEIRERNAIVAERLKLN